MMCENHCTTTITKPPGSQMHPNDLEFTVGNLLRKWRLKLGYTQKELAESLGVTKLHIYAQQRNLQQRQLAPSTTLH